MSREALDRVIMNLGIERGSERGMYGHLAKRVPLRIDEEIPVAVEALLKEHHTCACTNSDIVYVDTEKANEMFVRAKKVSDPSWKGKEVVGYDATNNYQTILVHEYTHVLMRHVEKGAKFVSANGDKNYPIFALACDIEANRGYGIARGSDIYNIGVTEDSYPECRGVEGLMNIYRTLKKYYGDEILKNYKEFANSGDDDEGENSSESKEGQGGESSMPESGSGESVSDRKAQERKSALKEAFNDAEKLKADIEKKMATMTREELADSKDDFDEEHGQGIGDGAEKEVGAPLSPCEVIKKEYNDNLKRDVEKAMSKLRGLVHGSNIMTRTKTYSRQSRKEGADGLIRKGVKNAKVLAPRILVAMDSSGSMNVSEVTPVATAIGTIAKTLGKTKGSYICEHDSCVKNLYPLSQWEKVVSGYHPYGDNDFDAVLRKALELKVEVVLNVGDGFEIFRDRELQKRAKAAGIKWYDVQVCGEYDTLKRMIESDDSRFGKDFVGREVIKVGGGD